MSPSIKNPHPRRLTPPTKRISVGKPVLQLLVAGFIGSTSGLFAEAVPCPAEMPGYLTGYESQWEADPRAANLAWFKEAKLGMFIHFSPASGIGRNGWAKADSSGARLQQKRNSLSAAEYGEFLLDKFEPRFLEPAARERIDNFTGAQFDADQIAGLAVAAGMKYVVFTTQHVNGRMFLFDTATSDLTSVQLAPKRDFVAELARACRKHDLGLFLYVMPPYVDPSVRGHNRRMLTELLTNYGPLAGVWFDGIGEALRRQQSFDAEEVSATYALVRQLQPHGLISFKTGYTGEEDYIAPEEHHYKYDGEGLPTLERKGVSEQIRELWNNNLRYKPIQSSYTLIEKNHWFYYPKCRYRTADQILERYRLAREMNQSLLLNIAPLYDGSISPEEEKILRELGKLR